MVKDEALSLICIAFDMWAFIYSLEINGIVIPQGIDGIIILVV